MRIARLLSILLLFVVFRSTDSFLTPFQKNSHKNENSLLEQISESGSLSHKYALALQLQSTKEQIKILDKIALKALRSRTPLFKKVNASLKEKGLKAGKFDAYGIAVWNYGEYYAFENDYEKAYMHYRKAKNIFKMSGYEYYEGKMLYNLAFLKGHFKDISEAKILTVQALELFKKKGRIRSQILALNHLSTLNQELKEYEKALENSHDALEILALYPENKHFFKEGILNNIGLTYQLKEQYHIAKTYFTKALYINPKIQSQNRLLYAQLTTNKYYSDYKLGKRKNVVSSMKNALRISDSLNHFPSRIYIRRILGDVKFSEGDTLTGVRLVKAANKLAKKTENVVEYLKTLNTLSLTDIGNANYYLEKHVAMNDSLQRLERELRGQFSLLDFENQNYIEQNKLLLKRSKRYRAMVFVVLILLVLCISFYTVLIKNQKLNFLSQKQALNEEVFFAVQIQQENFKKGVYQERNRISEELHDGILSKLFGIRMSMGFLKKEHAEYGGYLNDLQTVETEIRTLSHNLKDQLPMRINSFEVYGNLIKQKCDVKKINTHVSIDPKLETKVFSDEFKISLYRVIQESLQNIIKHSEAKNVFVSFKKENVSLNFSIHDDGVGFNVSAVHLGIGIKNMISRVDALGGVMDIESAWGNGTYIKIRFNTIKPVNHEETINSTFN